MTNENKLYTLRTILDDGGDLPSDEKLISYLSLSETEILNWMYSQIGGVPDGVTSVPTKYEVTQIYAVVAGYTHAGAEGERSHNENGIQRTFVYSDMLDYIHQNVLTIVRVGAVNAR